MARARRSSEGPRGPVSERLSRSRTLHGVPPGDVIRFETRWGVVCTIPSEDSRRHWAKLVDFWDGGLEYLPHETTVDQLTTVHHPLRAELVW